MKSEGYIAKPTTNTSAACIKQDSHAQKHTHNSPSPHPPPVSVETKTIMPSSTCSVLGSKVPLDSFILHVSSKLPAHHHIFRGRMAAGRTPKGSLAHGRALLVGSVPLISTHAHKFRLVRLTTHLKNVGAILLQLKTVLCFSLFISRCCKVKTKLKAIRQECPLHSMRLLFLFIPPEKKILFPFL